MKLRILLTTFFIFTFAGIVVFARYDTIDDTKLGIDEQLSGEITEFGMPDSIVVGLVYPPGDDFNIDFKTWYNGIYYYQVTRFGMPSISFHYVISPQGELITNKNSLSERKLNVKGVVDSESPILIGLFVENDQMGLNPRIQEKLGEIVLNIANQNAISMEKIFIKDLKFGESEQRNLIISASDTFGTWGSDMQKLKDAIKDKYVPAIKEYKVEIVGEPILPTEQIEVSSEFEVRIKVKNTGKEIIYGGSRGEFLMSLSGESEKSKFFINDIWASQTQVRLMKDGEIIKPNEEKEYIFKAKSPLEFGNVSENFDLVSTSSVKLSTAPIVIKVNIKKPEGTIIEVLETETGYLRVRENADFNSDEVERISPGERYFVIESQNGFHHIDLGNGKKGWVYSKYVKSIQ
jgi:hypothetical protein